MKLYKIYYRPDPKKYDNSMATLYAFTTKKELAKDFMKTRNSEIFILITNESDTVDQELYELIRTMGNKKLRKIIMKTKDYDSIKGFSKVTITGTGEEEIELMKTMEDYMIIFNDCFRLDYNIISKEYREPFDTLLYPLMYSWHKLQDDLPFPISEEELHQHLETHEKMKSLNIDEFELFLMRFGGTFKNPS